MLHSCPSCTTVFYSHAQPSSSTRNETTPVSSDISNTNNPAADAQIPSIRDFISNGLVRTTHLNETIASLQASLDKLIEERSALDIEIRKHKLKAALSPLRRIPPEILSHIFTFTLSSHSPSADSAPWIVSAVCARWRAITLSQSRLWSSVEISFPVIGTNTSMIQTQLSHSGESPLSVYFSCEFAEECTEEETEMMDILA
ncbi:hypothetical protein B0H17DRAFT_1196643 [Mycena rosella]|uniref:F-box domain-containing protein n=1 Tax=Mycena rosella TaxID=1033263 RepID=A0AAD7GKB7_MYCRO|nr:hypothetical protein B0H17DRAFT_1196643 [Mycena rosella]